MRNSLQRLKQKGTLLTSSIYTVFAFILMVCLCYLFMSNSVHDQLVQRTEYLLEYEQYKIDSFVMRAEITLESVSHAIRGMALGGGSLAETQKYIVDYSAHLQRDCKISGIQNLYCYFESFPDGPVFIGGINSNLQKDYDPTESDWYRKAVEAKGTIVEIVPKASIMNEGAVVKYALGIYDDKENRLAVICVDVLFQSIMRDVIKTASDRGGFGMLLDSNLTIIAHYVEDLVGTNLSELKLPVSVVWEELKQGQEIFERPVINVFGQKSIIFFKNLSNGWRLGVVIPEGPYYERITKMAMILIALGSAFSVLLVLGLIRIDSMREKSDEANSQKSSFLANMSHEIRTPMNAILGIAKIQLQDKTISASAREAIMMIHDSGEMLLNIINDILDMSKIEANKFEIMPIKYEIASLINNTMMLNLAKVGSKPIECVLTVDENIPATMFGDELRISQILNNLLSNSIKYTRKGIISLSVSVAPDCGVEASDEVMLTFKINDTGDGMSEEQVGKLYDKYSRFNMAANRTTQGTGLGMNITQNLLRMMRGEIIVTSALNVGTEFVVSIPQKKIGSEVLGKELSENLQMFRSQSSRQLRNAQIIVEPMPYGKILIVDDVESNLYVAKGLMKSYELNIETATSGFEAIDIIKNGNAYDIVFMDHMMPKMDGIEASKIIRNMGYKAPIVALTANAVVGQSEMFLNNGFDGFVSKPIDVRELNSVLKEFIRDKQPPEVIEAVRKKHTPASIVEIASNRIENTSIDKVLFEIFSRDAARAIVTLEEINEKKGAYTEEDIKNFIVTVHGMKSSLANFGEQTLSAVAAKLEKAGRDEDIVHILTETPKFLNNLKKLTEKYKTQEDTDDYEETDEDLQYLRERLLTIKEACITYEKKNARDALAELRLKKLTTKKKELLGKISEYLLFSDFEQASGTAESILKTL